MIVNFIKDILEKNDMLAWRLKLIREIIKKDIRFLKTRKSNDKEFIIKQYQLKTGLKLNLDNPVTYNEKLQWLKLNYHNPLLHICVDKYAVREYVFKKLEEIYWGGGGILIPCYGVFNNIDEIDFNTLPDQFVIKLTNGSSFNYICRYKNLKEIKKIKLCFKYWSMQNYDSNFKEWAYKGVKNRIVIEELLQTFDGNSPEDYRFFCFGGKVKIIAVDIESVIDGVKQSEYYRNIYNTQWELIPAQIGHPNKAGYDIPRPKQLEKLIEIAEKLSEDFPAVRVDLYYFDDKIYFSELTFYHGAGYQEILPPEFATMMGDWLDLKNVKSY